MSDFLFTITTEPLTGSGIPAVEFKFTHVAPGYGRFALDCKINAPIRDLIRYHPRGVIGNITIRDQTSGRPIILRAKIANTISLVRGDFKTMVEAFRAHSCAITDPVGFTYKSCNLVDGRMMEELPEGTTAAQDEASVEMDVEFTFTQDRDF